jgi:hypothetical protein
VFRSYLDEERKRKLQRREKVSEEERWNFYQYIIHFKLWNVKSILVYYLCMNLCVIDNLIHVTRSIFVKTIDLYVT